MVRASHPISITRKASPDKTGGLGEAFRQWRAEDLVVHVKGMELTFFAKAPRGASNLTATLIFKGI